MFYKKTTAQLLEHIGLQNIKVGGKANLGDLPLFVWCMLTLALKIFLVQIWMHAWMTENMKEIDGTQTRVVSLCLP